MPRNFFTLKCQECGEENYLTSKNAKAHPEVFETKKYCNICKKRTPHKEIKNKSKKKK